MSLPSQKLSCSSCSPQHHSLVTQQSSTHNILAVLTETGAISLHVPPSHPQMPCRLRPVHAFSTAKLVSVKRFTGEQSSNSVQPSGPSWPSHCGQLRGQWPLAQSLLPALLWAAQAGTGQRASGLRTESCCEPKPENSQH